MLKIHFDNGEVLEIPNVDLETWNKYLLNAKVDANWVGITLVIPKVTINLMKINYIEEV